MKRFFLIMLVFLAATACHEKDSFVNYDSLVSENQKLVEWTESQNAWIFHQVKQNYLWADQLKDSIEYDYSLEPKLFFESMKVPEDRFSYCEYNENYIGTKGSNLNETVSFDSVYVVNGMKAGYFVYDGFETEADVTDVFLKFRSVGIDELIIDLRYNHGGSVNTMIYLSSLIVPQKYLGKLFSRSEYNKRIAGILKHDTGSEFEYRYFRNDNLVRLRNLNMQRIFFLVTGNSYSCSEQIVNCLKPYMQVVTIGETTGGKDVGMRGLSNPKYKYTLWPITFRDYNADGIPVPVTGIVPDIFVENSRPVLMGTIQEPLLSEALRYITENI